MVGTIGPRRDEEREGLPEAAGAVDDLLDLPALHLLPQAALGPISGKGLYYPGHYLVLTMPLK
jgi:hypothetical protein